MTLNLSLIVEWDANGTHPDNAPRIHETIAKDKVAGRKVENIREDTQELLEDLEKQLQEIITPLSQPFNPGKHFYQILKDSERRQEWDRKRAEAQVEEEMRAQLLTHGAKPPGPLTPKTAYIRNIYFLRPERHDRPDAMDTPDVN